MHHSCTSSFACAAICACTHSGPLLLPCLPIQVCTHWRTHRFMGAPIRWHSHSLTHPIALSVVRTRSRLHSDQFLRTLIHVDTLLRVHPFVHVPSRACTDLLTHIHGCVIHFQPPTLGDAFICSPVHARLHSYRTVVRSYLSDLDVYHTLSFKLSLSN